MVGIDVGELLPIPLLVDVGVGRQLDLQLVGINRAVINLVFQLCGRIKVTGIEETYQPVLFRTIS